MKRSRTSRPVTRRSRLNCEQLDDRIVPSAAGLQLDVLGVLDVSIGPGKSDENHGSVESAYRHEIHSLEASEDHSDESSAEYQNAIKHLVKELKVEVKVEVKEERIVEKEASAVPATPPAAAAATVATAAATVAAATKSAAAPRDLLLGLAGVEAQNFVPVHGIVGAMAGAGAAAFVPTFVSTDLPIPHVIALDAAGVSGGLDEIPLTPGEANPEAQPVLPEAVPPEGGADGKDVKPPAIQDAEAVSRFVPFEPGALDAAIRRFLDNLKAQNSGMSIGLKVTIWTAVLAGGLMVAEFARRKKLPQKAAKYLSLSKYLTRTRTKMTDRRG